MKRVGSEITLAQAFELAKNAAEHLLRDMTEEGVPLLDESRYLEAPGCWMLFRNPSIVILPEHGLRNCAFAVSKHGDLRTIPDETANPPEFEAWVKKMADYFMKNEEAST